MAATPPLLFVVTSAAAGVAGAPPGGARPAAPGRPGRVAGGARGGPPPRRRATEISRRFNALLRIVSVMPEPMWMSVSEDAEDQVRSQHEAQKAFLDQFDLRGVALSRAVVWARHAAVEVLDEAQRYGEGLLVIGASSRAP